MVLLIRALLIAFYDTGCQAAYRPKPCSRVNMVKVRCRARRGVRNIPRRTSFLLLYQHQRQRQNRQQVAALQTRKGVW